LVKEIDFTNLPLRCSACGTVLKPDFEFFGEQLPEPANADSFIEAKKANVFIQIRISGEIMPSEFIPFEAKKNKNKIIEINIALSNFTPTITDISSGKGNKYYGRFIIYPHSIVL
jgi:NAD-dependent deacetylase